MNDKSNDLVKYLENAMSERGLSQRALALYSGISNSTVSRIMQGHQGDLETLNKLADYLKVSRQDLYRMAGKIVQEDDGKRHRIESLIQDLYAKLPPADQAEIVEIIRMKIARRNQGQ